MGNALNINAHFKTFGMQQFYRDLTIYWNTNWDGYEVDQASSIKGTSAVSLTLVFHCLFPEY